MTQTTEQIDLDEARATPLPTGVESLIARALAGVEAALETHPQADPADTASEAQCLREAARGQGLRVDVLSDDLQIMHNRTRVVGFYQGASSGLTLLDRSITRNRAITKRLLVDNSVPVAAGGSATSMQEALSVYRQIPGSAVVKPGQVGVGGRRWGTIDTEEELCRAVTTILRRTREVLVEQVVPGFNLRIAVIGGRAVSAMLRAPANVVGDGRRTVRQLIDEKNNHRTHNPYLRANPITISARTLDTLAHGASGLDTVPEAGVRVFLNRSQKLSAGGDSYELLRHVQPGILELAEHAAAAFKSSDHTRVDLLLERLDTHPGRQQCVVDTVKVNAEIRSFAFPAFGEPIDAGPAIVAAGIESADDLASDNVMESRPLRGRPWRIRPVKDGPDPTSLITELGREPTADDGDRPVHRPTSGRDLDRHLLRQELQQLGCSDVIYSGRLVHTTSGNSERVLERTGGTLFVRELAKDPLALHHIAQSLGIATVDRAVLGPDDLLEAERLVSQTPGRWRVHIGTASGRARRALHVTSVSRLERKWHNFPLSTHRVIVERIPERAACVVLVLAGKAVATVLREPFTIVGDGIRDVETLLRDKLRRRAANPYLRSVPVRPSLLDSPALARRGLEAGQVPKTRSIHRLARSPEHRLGVDTYGLGPNAYPKLATAAERLVDTIGSPKLASVSFALATEDGPATGPAPWALWGLETDPVLSEFTFPWAGHNGRVFEPAARSLLECDGHSLAETV